MQNEFGDWNALFYHGPRVMRLSSNASIVGPDANEEYVVKTAQFRNEDGTHAPLTGTAEIEGPDYMAELGYTPTDRCVVEDGRKYKLWVRADFAL